MTLRRVGFFRELHPDDPGLPSVHAAIRDEGHPDEGRIVAYLEAGVCVAACGGVQFDVVEPSSGHVTSPDMVSDGDWLWPGELAYYVSRYHVALPAEFTNSLRRKAWQTQTLSDDEVNALFRQVFPNSVK